MITYDVEYWIVYGQTLKDEAHLEWMFDINMLTSFAGQLFQHVGLDPAIGFKNSI